MLHPFDNFNYLHHCSIYIIVKRAHSTPCLQVLRFKGYFSEQVEGGRQVCRVRPVIIYYYLVDDAIAVTEPRIPVSLNYNVVISLTFKFTPCVSICDVTLSHDILSCTYILQVDAIGVHIHPHTNKIKTTKLS